MIRGLQCVRYDDYSGQHQSYTQEIPQRSGVHGTSRINDVCLGMNHIYSSVEQSEVPDAISC